MKCTKCGRHTPTGAFATYRNQDGEIRRRGICKECRGRYAIENFDRLKKWREEYNYKNRTKRHLERAESRVKIRKIIDEIKTKTPCADCFKNFPSVAMDFDHIHGKNKSIAGLVSGAYKIELILEEIKLCEVVCACCHRIRTADRRQNHALKIIKNISCI